MSARAELNDLYKLCQTRRELNLRASDYSKKLSLYLGVPSLFLGTAATSLTAISLLDPSNALKIAAIIASFGATYLTGLLQFLEVKENIGKYHAIAEQYEYIQYFIERERDVNLNRDSDFYSFENPAEIFKTSAEYYRYLFDHITSLLEVINDKPLPHWIDQTVITKDL